MLYVIIIGRYQFLGHTPPDTFSNLSSPPKDVMAAAAHQWNHAARHLGAQIVHSTAGMVSCCVLEGFSHAEGSLSLRCIYSNERCACRAWSSGNAHMGQVRGAGHQRIRQHALQGCAGCIWEDYGG